MLAAVFIFQRGVLQHSSPLALLIIVTAGWLLSLKFKLVGSIFLFFGGLALAVHPLMFSSSYWLIPGGALIGFAGFLIFINWWRKNDN
jgi:hypothetical protein